MSAAALGHHAETFYASTVGKKAVMAISGCALFLFVLAHLAGNLQIYEGPEKLNNYSRTLHSMPALLWGARIGLLVMVGLHIWSSFQLASAESRRPAHRLRQERKPPDRPTLRALCTGAAPSSWRS